jgi:DNA/RNA-binding domain of Phe-tRNA-synthetase-like protein
MSVPLRVEVADPDLVLGVVEVDGATIGPSSAALAEELDRTVAARGAGPWPPEDVRAAVRDLLRRGGYKPTGRGKPASEFLAQAAARGEFPRIANAVDALNLVSFDTGLPISLLDADRALADAPGLVVRRGAPGEAYVFNASGQTIDVEGLLCVCREGGPPLGNAVKDSMETKVRPESRRLVAVIFGSRAVAPPPRMSEVAERLAALLRQETGGTASVRVL